MEATQPKDKPLRIAIYCRVSTEDQAEDAVSIPAQIRECQDYASQKGWLVMGTFKDEGFSGRTEDRPDFQRMIALAKQRPAPFDAIVVWKLNRFSRTVEHRAAYQSLLRRRGIKLISLKEPALEGAMAVLVDPILAAIDEFMALQVAEDTLRGLKEVARQGYSAGGRPPVGYRPVREVVSLKKDGEPRFRTTWQPDPVSAPKLREAFEMAAQGRTSQDIIEATGICKNKSSLSTILRNRAYLGERVYNKERHLGSKRIRRKNSEEEWIVTPNAHPAIVPKELFAKVQQNLTTRQPNTGTTRALASDFLLTPILWCSRHNCRYVAYPIKDRAYYICSERNKKGTKEAPCVLLKKEALEGFILQKLREELFTPQRLRPLLEELATAAVSRAEQNRKEARKLQAEVSKLDVELERFYKAVSEGIPAAHLSKPIEERQTQREKLSTRLGTIEHSLKTPKTIELTEEMVKSYIERAWEHLEKAEGHERKSLLQECVSKIEMDGDKVTIYYTFVPPTQEVGFYWLPEQDSNLQPSG